MKYAAIAMTGEPPATRGQPAPDPWVPRRDKRRHLQGPAGHPSLPLMEQGEVGNRRIRDARKFASRSTALVEGEIQVTVADLGQLARHPQPVLSQGRVQKPTGQHQLDGLGWPSARRESVISPQPSWRPAEMEVVPR